MVNRLAMRPVSALVLHEAGEQQARIGPETRRVKYTEFKRLEELIIKHALLPISADIGPIHPPYFTEFTYTDVFGGLLVGTLSAEINYRLVLELGRNPQEHIRKLFMDFQDKYIQTPLPDAQTYPLKVIFMTGTNLFMKVVNTDYLDEMMATDSWMIKPHPLTNESHLREYGAKYGYHRIIDKSISGHELYAQASTIGSVVTSEFSLRALIDGKPLVDFTNFSERHTHTYSPFVEASRIDVNPSTAIQNKLADADSGFLFPSLSDEENITRLHAYQRKALQLREPFRMLTHQQLIVRRKPDAQPSQPRKQA